MIGVRTYRRVQSCSGSSSSTWFLKKVLGTMILVGSLSSTIGGTFALLNSQESNTGSTIASGTLTLSDTVNTGTACFSYGAGSSGNVNNACSAIFTSAAQNYPGTPATSKVTLLDNGSLDVKDLTLYMPSPGCSTVATPGAPAPGGGDMCAAAGAQIYIQETDSVGTATKCWFPSSAGVTCAFTGTSTLFVFKSNYTSTVSSLDLGSGPAHAASRYFTIGMQLPSTAANTLQGEAAQFGLTWHISN